jgi:hypothetical protein
VSIEYKAKAMGIRDSEKGEKVLVFATTCGRTLLVTVAPNMADFTIKLIGAPVAHD